MSDVIPRQALENHIVILAKTGAGKSNAAKTVVEGMLDRAERVCVIDPTGTWYGLRLMPNGKPSPYKVLIFGGNHADVQIGAGDGAAIAEVVGTSATSCIIDTRLLSVGARTQFFTAFAETLLAKNVGVLNLIIDEAHLFAPKGKVNDPKSGMMLGAAANLVSLGRGIGLRITMLSQRPAKFHNDCLSCAETLVAMRMLLPADRDAVMSWVKEHADPEQGRQISASLSGLPTGDAWIWSPQLDLLERRTFPLVRTKDTGRPPRPDEAAVDLEPLQIDEITQRLAEVAAEVVANDPKHLKAEVARLKAELAKGGAVSAEQAQEIRIAAQVEARADFFERVRYQKALARRGALAEMRYTIEAMLEATELPDEPLTAAEADAALTPGPMVRRPAQAEPQIRQAEPEKSTTPEFVNGAAEALTGPQLKVLKSLAWWRAMGKDAPTRNQVAIMAGWSTNSSNIRDRVSDLARRGLIERPQANCVRLTEAGRAAAPRPDMGATMHDSIRLILTAPQTAVFEALREAQRPVHRDDLAIACGWSTNSSNIRDRVSDLARLDIIERPAPGLVALQAWVNE